MNITSLNTPFSPSLRPISPKNPSFQVGTRVVYDSPTRRTQATNAPDLGTITKTQSTPDFKGLRSNPKSSPAVFDLVKKQRYKQQNHK